MKVDVEMILLEKSILVQMIENCINKSGQEISFERRQIIADEIGMLTQNDLITEHNVKIFIDREVEHDS